MIKLKTKTFVTDIKVEDFISSHFKEPIVFYLAHNEDKRLLFVSFVLLDFVKKQIVYVKTFFPENVALVEKDRDEKISKITNSRYNPHKTFETIKAEEFLTFVEYSKYFYQVNLKKQTATIYTVTDLSEITNLPIEFICCTPYKEGNFFYTTALAPGDTEARDLYFFKVNLDLSKYELIHTQKDFIGFVPHVTKKFGNYIFCSEFTRERLNFKGNIISSQTLMEFVYEDLYKEFCESKNVVFSKEKFLEENKIMLEGIRLQSEFDAYVKSKGNNFLEICQNTPKYNFTAEPGLITVLNLKTHEMKSYHTTTCTPAHFEFDDECNYVYASSHNFVYLDKHYYLGPSVIDKFLIENGELKKIKSFTTPNGFRFTTHKVFKHEGKSYLCTFGHPTRLFFVDADTMELLFHEDIEYQDILPNEGNITNFINANNGRLNKITIKAVEVSDDGRFIIILSYNYVYVYDFAERKIVQKIRYLGDVNLDKDLNLKDFYQKTTHFDFLK